jgi:hypothetical protein
MKALLVLVVIYVGAFFIAIQGASQTPVEAAPHSNAGGAQTGAHVDATKEADIRSLMELVGARDTIQDATAKQTEQFRETLTASIPDNDRGQQFVNAFVSGYGKKFNAGEVTDQLVAIYDKHFTDEDIKGLLQFYGSPLGQRVAAEMPKINAETQAANRAVGTRVAKEVLQDLRKQYPALSAQARLVKPRGGLREQAKQQSQAQPQAQPETQPETQASASQP